jgi:hypothetical protein
VTDAVKGRVTAVRAGRHGVAAVEEGAPMGLILLIIVIVL